MHWRRETARPYRDDDRQSSTVPQACRQVTQFVPLKPAKRLKDGKPLGDVKAG
ncbi:MAG TPA: hypothetical protein VGB85_15205 [Nannocystis sp.]